MSIENTNLKIEHQTLQGQSLFLNGKAESRNSIWMCELIDCDIKSTASARAFGFIDSTMKGGVFWQQVVLKNKYFDRVRFNKVKFKGRYQGVVFGGRKNNHGYGVDAGALEGCDLTEAKLHLCSHFNGDFSSNKYAGWPTVVVRCGEALVAPEFPSTHERGWSLLVKIFDKHPAGESAAIVNAETLSKEDSIPLVELRRFFELNHTAVISGL